MNENSGFYLKKSILLEDGAWGIWRMDGGINFKEKKKHMWQ